MSQQPPTEMATPPNNDPTQHAQAGLSRRMISWLATCALVVVVIASIFIFNGLANRAQQGALASTAPNKLLGVTLDDKPLAPDITLKDQNGQTVRLSQLRGKPVVLTFFDSHCPHYECPLMAVGLRSAVKSLGAQASQAEWVALSMNPTDTPASAAAFLKNNGVTFPLHYLLGTPEELAPLWKAYHMQSMEDPSVKGVIIHSTGIYIIDQQGRERVFLDIGFDPRQLSNDIQYLLAHP